jgi:sugar lactone lactonase YvrE
VIHFVKDWIERFRGQGDHSIATPVFDGPLKANRVLEDAEIFVDLESPEDLATDGKSLFVADGKRVLKYMDDKPSEVAEFGDKVTALCCLPDGGLVVALDGKRVVISGGKHDGREFMDAQGRPFVSVNAISLGKSGQLLITQGSAKQPYENWCHDLMEHGSTGKIIALDLANGAAKEVKRGLHYAFGVQAVGDRIWVSETWKHRIVSVGTGVDQVVLDWLPGYPCRISEAASGGYWLCALAGRTQLVEFVLRENAYRRRMIKEIDPAYWIAPALSSGDDFLEPLQSAHVKMRGVLKPYAPPRSYGLVIRLNEKGEPIGSFHSRLDGKNHGVVAAVEVGGNLYVLAKGRRRILRIPTSAH